MSDAGFLLIVGKIGPNFFGFQVTSWRIERFEQLFWWWLRSRRCSYPSSLRGVLQTEIDLGMIRFQTRRRLRLAGFHRKGSAIKLFRAAGVRRESATAPRPGGTSATPRQGGP